VLIVLRRLTPPINDKGCYSTEFIGDHSLSSIRRRTSVGTYKLNNSAVLLEGDSICS
jgi:hypothetical protein